MFRFKLFVEFGITFLFFLGHNTVHANVAEPVDSKTLVDAIDQFATLFFNDFKLGSSFNNSKTVDYLSSCDGSNLTFSDYKIRSLDGYFTCNESSLNITGGSKLVYPSVSFNLQGVNLRNINISDEVDEFVIKITNFEFASIIDDLYFGKLDFKGSGDNLEIIVSNLKWYAHAANLYPNQVLNLTDWDFDLQFAMQGDGNITLNEDQIQVAELSKKANEVFKSIWNSYNKRIIRKYVHCVVELKNNPPPTASSVGKDHCKLQLKRLSYKQDEPVTTTVATTTTTSTDATTTPNEIPLITTTADTTTTTQNTTRTPEVSKLSGNETTSKSTAGNSAEISLPGSISVMLSILLTLVISF